MTPKLQAAGWDASPYRLREQVGFTDGRIIVLGNKARRATRKRADYLLDYRPDFPIGVVEAKAKHKTLGAGLQQVKAYAEILGLKFAYASNGEGILEFDYLTGMETLRQEFPKPEELWERLSVGQRITPEAAEKLLAAAHHLTDKSPRYYQTIAINRTVEEIAKGNRRVLLTLATGTGKTLVAFQICWKLTHVRWNAKGEYRRPNPLPCRSQRSHRRP